MTKKMLLSERENERVREIRLRFLYQVGMNSIKNLLNA